MGESNNRLMHHRCRRSARCSVSSWWKKKKKKGLLLECSKAFAVIKHNKCLLSYPCLSVTLCSYRNFSYSYDHVFLKGLLINFLGRFGFIVLRLSADNIERPIYLLTWHRTLIFRTRLFSCPSITTALTCRFVPLCSADLVAYSDGSYPLTLTLEVLSNELCHSTKTPLQAKSDFRILLINDSK